MVSTVSLHSRLASCIACPHTPPALSHDGLHSPHHRCQGHAHPKDFGSGRDAQASSAKEHDGFNCKSTQRNGLLHFHLECHSRRGRPNSGLFLSLILSLLLPRDIACRCTSLCSAFVSANWHASFHGARPLFKSRCPSDPRLLSLLTACLA